MDDIITEQLQERVINKTHEMFYVLMNKLFLGGSYLQPSLPYIKFNLKGKTAGKTYVEDNVIKFNMYFIEHNLNDFLRDTVPHEVAHLYEWSIYRSIGHKKHWKEFMQMMGVLNPKRCHYYLTVKK
jgi:predicted SprT family Zn-dependent metalloprotease